MSIEKLIADNTAALNALTAAILANSHGQLQLPIPGQADAGTVLSTTATTTKKTTGKAAVVKHEKPVAEEVVQTAEEVVEDTPAVEEATDTPTTVTFDDVKDVTIALGKANKRDGLVKLLGRFNVAKASELTEDSYAAYHSAATLLLEA